MLAWLFAEGHAVDVVLTVILVEGVLLVAVASWPVSDAVLALMPGALMMLALRVALAGPDWRVIGLLLALSFPVHLADLRRRRRSKPAT